MPTARELMEAILLTNNGVGQPFAGAGGGGAAEFAKSEDFGRFLKTPLGILYGKNGGLEAQKAAYDQFRRGGALSFEYGRRPDEATMNRYLDKVTGSSAPRSMGPNAAIGAVAVGGAGRGAAQRQTTGQSASMPGQVPSGQPGPGQQGWQPSLLDLFLMQAQADFNKRNEAVAAREKEIRDSKSDLYDRVMGRVDNWGKAEETRMREESEDAYNDKLAYLTAKGLDSSTIVPAFKSGEDRRLRQSLQELSERKDDRAIKYDTSLTQDKDNFVERIVDRGPQMSEIVQLAQQLGLSGQGGGLAGLFSGGGMVNNRSVNDPMPQPTQSGGARPVAMPQPSGPMMTPWGPVQRANYNPMAGQPIQANIFPGNPLNPLSVLGATQAGINQITGVPQATTADRRGTWHRTPEQWEEYDRRQGNEALIRQLRIADRIPGFEASGGLKGARDRMRARGQVRQTQEFLNQIPGAIRNLYNNMPSLPLQALPYQGQPRPMTPMPTQQFGAAMQYLQSNPLGPLGAYAPQMPSEADTFGDAAARLRLLQQQRETQRRIGQSQNFDPRALQQFQQQYGNGRGVQGMPPITDEMYFAQGF